MHILIVPSEHYVTKELPLASIFQHQQAHALKEGGFKVGVVSAGFVPFRMNFKTYSYPPFEQDNGINIYRCYKKTFIPGRISIKIFSKWFVDLYLKKFKKYIGLHGKPDIVHAHNCLHAGVVALKIKKQFDIPFVITEHSTAYARGLISNQQGKLTKVILKNADAITVVSTELGKLLENLYGADARPNYPIFNILDATFEKGKHLLEVANNNRELFTFLSIGSLESKKNHVDLLKAFACKFKNNMKVKLKIGGDGPLRNQLENGAKKYGIHNQVVFTGLLSRNDVLNEMLDCDAFVLPSLVETFGVVLIEALALGKPVVATKCGGPEDIVNQDNGILVPTKEIHALAEAMEDIYLNRERYDENKIRSDCLARFGKDAFINRLQSIYTSVLEGRKKGIEE